MVTVEAGMVRQPVGGCLGGRELKDVYTGQPVCIGVFFEASVDTERRHHRFGDGRRRGG